MSLYQCFLIWFYRQKLGLFLKKSLAEVECSSSCSRRRSSSSCGRSSSSSSTKWKSCCKSRKGNDKDKAENSFHHPFLPLNCFPLRGDLLLDATELGFPC